MSAITKKRMLYKSKVEYMSGEGIYAMNHIQGCSHGCEYPCYAYLSAKRYGKAECMDRWIEPQIVDNTIELLRKELAYNRKEPVKRVHMCFMSDPFMYQHPEVRELTIACMREINAHGIPVTVLTKGQYGVDWEREAEVFAGHTDNEFGITLVTTNDGFRERFEPGASPMRSRALDLYDLHRHDLRTWVSMEPFPALTSEGIIERWGKQPDVPLCAVDGLDDFPSDEWNHLRECLSAMHFTDRIVFGRWNYNKEMPRDVDDLDEWYAVGANIVRRFCRANGIECVIKKGTAKDV